MALDLWMSLSFREWTHKAKWFFLVLIKSSTGVPGKVIGPNLMWCSQFDFSGLTGGPLLCKPSRFGDTSSNPHTGLSFWIWFWIRTLPNITVFPFITVAYASCCYVSDRTWEQPNLFAGLMEWLLGSWACSFHWSEPISICYKQTLTFLSPTVLLVSVWSHHKKQAFWIFWLFFFRCCSIQHSFSMTALLMFTPVRIKLPDSKEVRSLYH